MNYSTLWMSVVFCIAVVSSLSASASTQKANYSDKIIQSNYDANSVRVRCFTGEASFYLSVASVLETHLYTRKSRRLDVALTTGHGLIGKNGERFEDCYVYDPDGRKIKVLAIKIAPNFQEASATDWAVLVFERIKTKRLIRYSVDPKLSELEFEKMARAKTDVQFTKARGILQNKQMCHLYPRRNAGLADQKYEGMLSHSCKAISGQSGSPVSVDGIDGEIIIGIHLGSSFSLPIKNVKDRAGWLGFMRIVDSSFLVELEAIVSDLEHAY